MRIENLIEILKIAKIGSISSAAKHLWIGQTTLSSIVKSVEEELNFKLFIRTPRGVKLTTKGERAIQIIEEIIDNYEQLTELSDHYYSNIVCKVACYPAFTSIIGPSLGSFLANEPYDAVLQLSDVYSRKSISYILNGMTDIGIATVTNIELPNEKAVALNNDLTFELLYTDNFCLFTNTSSTLANYDVIDISELADFRLTMVSYDPKFTGFFPSVDFRQFHNHSVFDNFDCIKRTLELANTAAIVPSLTLKDDFFLRNGLIKQVKLTGFDTELNNFMVHKDVSKLSPIDIAAIDFIRNFFQAYKK